VHLVLQVSTVFPLYFFHLLNRVGSLPTNSLTVQLCFSSQTHSSPQPPSALTPLNPLASFVHICAVPRTSGTWQPSMPAPSLPSLRLSLQQPTSSTSGGAFFSGGMWIVSSPLMCFAAMPTCCTCMAVKYPKLLLRPGRPNSGHMTPQSRSRLSHLAPSRDALDLRYSDHVTPVT
jgi:hypothetical protein